MMTMWGLGIQKGGGGGVDISEGYQMLIVLAH